jgi:methylmalonyl-CoA mutase cobalamin-binding subunit
MPQALLLKRDRLTALEEASCPRERSRPRVVLGLCGSACTQEFGTRLLANLIRDADVRVVCSQTVDSWAPGLRRQLEDIVASHEQEQDGYGRPAFGASVLSDWCAATI